MEKTELGAKIKEVRIERKMTQETLAEKADIGAMYLGEIERGVKMPTVRVFVKIIEALQVSADYILRNEISSGRDYALDEITEKLAVLTPRQRKTASDILDAYIKNLNNSEE